MGVGMYQAHTTSDAEELKSVLIDEKGIVPRRKIEVLFQELQVLGSHSFNNYLLSAYYM